MEKEVDKIIWWAVNINRIYAFFQPFLKASLTTPFFRGALFKGGFQEQDNYQYEYEVRVSVTFGNWDEMLKEYIGNWCWPKLLKNMLNE